MRPLCRLVAAATTLMPALALAQSPSQPAVVGTTAQRTAVVETVNARERSVLVRGEDGTLATVIVGPEIRNFAQIKPGDRVVATRTDAIAASLARPEARGDTGSAAVATRAAEGQRPGASVTEAQRVRVRIEGIDLGRNSVSYVAPDGARREVRVRDPGMRRFMRTLRPGDEVDVVFLESYSLRVLPPG